MTAKVDFRQLCLVRGLKVLPSTKLFIKFLLSLSDTSTCTHYKLSMLRNS